MFRYMKGAAYVRIVSLLNVFPIIIAFKMMGWIVKGILGIFKMIGVADFFWKL